MSERWRVRRRAPSSGQAPPDAVQAVGLRADPRTNTVVKWVLRSGLVGALGLLLTGLVVQLGAGNHVAVQVKMFDLFAPRPLGERIMAVGVLALTLTPACGVLSVLLGWAREGDRRYVVVGGVVVAVLGAAVLVGLG